MLSGRLKQLAPYVVVLAGAVFFFGVANRIEYMPIPGQIGPDIWPKLILALLIAVCCFQIGRQVLWPTAPRKSDASLPADPTLDLENQTENPLRVGGVIAASVVYLLVLEIGGFFICTLVYTACLLGLGGVRRPATIVSVSVAITLFFTFTFMKVIFVSLPIGIEPFARVSLGVMSLLGIH